MDYTQHFSTKETPQSQPIPGRNDMVANSAGGYTFEISPWQRLERFLILGSEGGTYYSSEKKLTKENAENVIKCIALDGKRTVDEIARVSHNNLAPKNDPAIFGLALCMTFGDNDTRYYAYNNLTKVCRIGTHLFTFCTAIQSLRGWSAGLRKSVQGYYSQRDATSLVYDLLKYPSRGGFAHRDVLRLAHLRPKDELQRRILGYAVGRTEEDYLTAHPMIEAVELLRNSTVPQAVNLITEHKLPREVVPTALLNDKRIWEALLPHMPLTAMMRNLNKMTSVGLIEHNLSDATRLIEAKLASPDDIRRARIHPFNALMSYATYSKGKGVKGSLTWNPVPRISAKLEDVTKA